MAATVFRVVCAMTARTVGRSCSLLGDQCAIAPADDRAAPCSGRPMRRPQDSLRTTLKQREHPRTEPPSRHRDPRSALQGVDRPQARRRVPRHRQHDAGLHRASRRRHHRRRRRQPPHRPRVRHRRHHDRQRVAARRRGSARAGRRLHPHLLHDHAVRGVRRRRRALNRLTPGDFEKRSALFNSGSEAVENAVKIARTYTQQTGGGVVRPRLSRAHQPDHGADREVDALQARLRPVRAGDLPRAAVLPVPRRGVRQGDGHRRRVGRQAARSTSSRSRSAPPTWPPSSSSRSRARADSSSPRTVSCPRCWTGARTTMWCSSPTRCRRGSPAPARCSPASTRASCPT